MLFAVFAENAAENQRKTPFEKGQYDTTFGDAILFNKISPIKKNDNN